MATHWLALSAALRLLPGERGGAVAERRATNMPGRVYESAHRARSWGAEK
jgi:hypothetical protein